MKKYSILIVDDNEIDRYLITRLIKDAEIGEDIVEAINGAEALKFLEDYEQNQKALGEKFPPDVIFLDINMPIMNGFEFLDAFAKLRDSHLEYKSIVLLMLSSSDLQEDQQHALSYDFVQGYIQKLPSGPEELRAAVEPFLP